MPLRCDKEGHGTRGDSEKAVQGVHDRFGDSEKAVQGVHGRFTHCKRAAQVLHGRFTHCERAVQVLHSPATHCERAAQVLHSHFTHCARAVQVLHSHFTHCERAVQVLHSHFTHCAGATHVLHTHFTHCDGLRKGGRREFTRLRRFTPKPLFARYDRDNSPPPEPKPGFITPREKAPRAPFGFDWAVTFGADFSERGGIYYYMRPTDELWKRDSSPMGGVQARKIYYNTTIEE